MSYKVIKHQEYSLRSIIGIIGIIGMMIMGNISGYAADKVVAKIDKETITQSDFSNEWNSIDRSDITASTTISLQEEKMKVLNLLVDRRILFNQIKKENIKIDPRLIDQQIAAEKMSYKTESDFNRMLQDKKYTLKEYRDYIEETLQMQQFLIRHVYSQISVMNAEIEQYYAIHSTYYFTPQQFKLRTIFIKVPANASAEEKGEKLAKAKLALLKIKLGSMFEDIARTNSDGGNAIRGGDAGYVTLEMLKRAPELADAISKLSIGELSDVIETKYGYYILKVEAIVPGRAKRFWEVRDQIQKDLSRERTTALYTQFLDDLRKQYQIELFPENLP